VLNELLFNGPILFDVLIQLDATGRPDESLTAEMIGLLHPTTDESLEGKLLSFALQKGQLKVNMYYLPGISTNLEACDPFFTVAFLEFFHVFNLCILDKLINNRCVSVDTALAT